MRRYEVQKQSSIVNAMVRLSSQYNTAETTKHNLTMKLQAHMWDAQDFITFIKQKGFTPESLTAKAMSEVREEIQKLDALIALRVKSLGQLQQSYEALVNRSVMQERLKLQNELLMRDLQAIDVKAVEQFDSDEVKARGQRKAKSGK